jgi:hypothetical protein
MKTSEIPHSPKGRPKGEMPQCSAIAKGTGQQCRAKAAGREALERLELLKHEHAGEWCAFHLLGARELQNKSAAVKRKARKAREAVKLAEKLGIPLPGIDKPADKSQPGEEVVEIDAALGVLRRVGEDSADSELAVARPVNLATIEVGSVFQYLTPEQRKKLLRARLRGN